MHPIEYPGEAYLLESLSEEVWNKYQQLIRLYKEGHSVEVGWYRLIRGSLLDLGVDPRSAHILSDLRDEL